MTHIDDADARTRLLYWVDITGNKLHIYDPVTHTDRVLGAGPMPSTVVPRASGGGVVLGTKTGIASFHPDTGEFKLLAEPEKDTPNNRFNYGTPCLRLELQLKGLYHGRRRIGRLPIHLAGHLSHPIKIERKGQT